MNLRLKWNIVDRMHIFWYYGCYLLEKLEDERAADVDMADVDVKLQVFVVKRFFEFLDMWNVVLLFWLPGIELFMFI